MTSTYRLFAFLLLLCLAAKRSTAACHVDDEAGLLGFKSGVTQDLSGMLSTWKPGTDCCKWNGVTCRENNSVTSISLGGQDGDPKSFLSGTISPSLAKIRNLDSIYFQNLRNITGTFPRLLFDLPKLVYVYIENNKLSGPLPVDIGKLSRLGALSLSGNRFSGTIPSSISQLTQLTQLKLDRNALTGTIPDGIRNLKSLTFLALDGNGFSGEIPDFFNSFPKLLILQLSNNKLSGEFPASIASLAPTLMYLEMGNNLLSGKIPDFIGNFKKLDTLDLSSNKFTGVVPKSLRKLTKIFNLNLARNNLVDPFPELAVKGIESLDLSYNKFHLGQIPKWVASSPIIYSLKLAGCGIKQRLDDFNPSETYFYDYIDLSDNMITGSPLQLLNRIELLKGFWASGNQLRFNLTNLKFPTSLKQLDLSRNLIFGTVPASIAGLEKVNVSHNHLCGKLPVTKFPASAFEGNDCLCGSPLPPCRR